MPAATPVCRTRSDVARARIMSPSTRPPCSTPTISASKASMRSPSNTVFTTAFWPEWISETSSVGTEGEPAVAAVGSSGPTRKMSSKADEGVTVAHYNSRSRARQRAHVREEFPIFVRRSGENPRIRTPSLVRSERRARARPASGLTEPRFCIVPVRQALRLRWSLPTRPARGRSTPWSVLRLDARDGTDPARDPSDETVQDKRNMIGRFWFAVSLALALTGVVSGSAVAGKTSGPTLAMFEDPARLNACVAFSWGAVLYARATQLDARCWRIVWKDPAGNAVRTDRLPGIAPTRDIVFTLPATGPSGAWTAELQQGDQNPGGLDPCTGTTSYTARQVD